MRATRLLTFGLLVPAVLSVSAARALTITAQLTGDPRAGNPDGIVVDVTVTVDDGDRSLARWVVDLNSALHPEAKLDEFYFNLSTASGKFAPGGYSFSNFNPGDWRAATPATVQGAGGATFTFEMRDGETGGEKKHGPWVTNGRALSFDLRLLSGSFTLSDFLDAPRADGRQAGFGQLGAHIQTLEAGRGESDSGFAFGNYAGEQIPVPEPGSLRLLGGGLLGLLGSLVAPARIRRTDLLGPESRGRRAARRE